MKHIFAVFLILTITASFCLHISANSTSANVITINDIEIIFTPNTTLTNEQKQFVAQHFVDNNSNIQTYGLICNLFGHKTTTEYVTTITHCVRDTVPRCLDEEWELIICSRCESIIEETRIAYSYRNCCPVD